ncbi:Asp23/Gls24 family envelope stress response protein [Fuchsiella alkaliacetigena]|uniref:Asp23/Gls24 family envelope stress response protein n=1 Tax=Fuchsiella alkaliacetigena TaxID=957042 RepID=UPI00200A5BE2|nr:Asp23/Gls24 family envelope stress response protein [Fuchsiella alkaliacetigena]MCK8825477.1 Asp23/Gls24 family envelope stress response protein [Fuchsiella alkaliacetigena]
MEIYALIGPSGTGKSHRARLVAYSQGIDYIIDDGLLIKNSKVIAGKSAKEADNMIRAVKVAIFMEEEHAGEVKEALAVEQAEKVLILGTSLRMVERIVAVLELGPEIEEIIKIEEIASEEEIAEARKQRGDFGKHVIPVPNIEIKPNFSGYLMESLELLFFNKDDQIKTEKTIIRPKFSYYGKLLIADGVIVDLIEHTLGQDSRVVEVKKVKVDQQQRGSKVIVEVVLNYGLDLPQVLGELQFNIKEMVEYSTGINILRVDMEVVDLAV